MGSLDPEMSKQIDEARLDRTNFCARHVALRKMIRPNYSPLVAI
jgi:hypothetical protein